MFDDIPQKNSIPPNNLPSESSEPVDMFSDIDGGSVDNHKTALDSGALKEKSSGIQAHPESMRTGIDNSAAYPAKSPILGKIILVIIILSITVGVSYGAWRIYEFFNGDKLSSTSPVAEEDNQLDNNIINSDEIVVDVEGIDIDTVQSTTTDNTDTTSTNILVEDLEKKDTDKDGLSDAKEIEFKTDVNVADTDKDGLSDGDEVIIWGTDPSNPDTDGDSYFDGDEVKSGYNPLGSGKLFDNNNENKTTSTLPENTTSSIIAENTTSSFESEPDF